MGSSGRGRARRREEHGPPVNICLPPPKLALGAALVNVQIPLLLGQLVEIVAKYTRDHVGSFLTESRSLGTHLLILYGLQVQQKGGPGGCQRSRVGAPQSRASLPGPADLRVPGAAVPCRRARGRGHAEGPLQQPAPVLPASGRGVRWWRGPRGPRGLWVNV